MAEFNEDGVIVSDQSIYLPQTWFDEVDKCTPITAERLNYMELGIADVAERCDSLSQKAAFTGNRRFKTTYSIGAGSWADAKFTIPANLEVIALCGYSSGNYYVTVSQVEATNGSANMRLFNEASTQIDNQTATVVVNCRTRPSS